MPELPEVETVVRSLRPKLAGRTILRAEVRSRRVTRQDFAATEQGLTGAKVIEISRLGKQIFIHLDRGVLYVHLGMTGKLLVDAPEDKFTRAVLDLDSGTVQFNDIRQFGRFEYLPDGRPGQSKKGPDALDVSLEIFEDRLSRHRGFIKAVLLNQNFVSGIGNIYADEILFRSRVHPKARAGRISKSRVRSLHRSTLEVLGEAVQLKGSSISDYVDAEGARGSFQDFHNVYGKPGEPCPRCGAPIRRIVIAQRGTHYCPRCQRV